MATIQKLQEQWYSFVTLPTWASLGDGLCLDIEASNIQYIKNGKYLGQKPSAQVKARDTFMPCTKEGQPLKDRGGGK